MNALNAVLPPIGDARLVHTCASAPYVAMQTGGLMGGWTVMTLGEAMGSDTHLRAAAATAPLRGLAKTGRFGHGCAAVHGNALAVESSVGIVGNEVALLVALSFSPVRNNVSANGWRRNRARLSRTCVLWVQANASMLSCENRRDVSVRACGSRCRVWRTSALRGTRTAH